MKIIWLASYPKSGNTWLRFFLYAYLFGEIKNSSDVARRIPDLHVISGLDTNEEGSILIKTHGLCSTDHPHIKNTFGCIYIMRHPKDILLSGLNYRRMEGDDELSDEAFAAEFIENLGAVKWRDIGLGNWVEHINSWTAGIKSLNCPLLMIRYEDLLKTPKQSFTRVVKYLNLELDEQRLDDAISQCSFERISQLEASEKAKNIYSPVFIREQIGAQGRRFMNKGQMGGTLSGIAEGLDESFDSKFKPYLTKFGYET